MKHPYYKLIQLFVSKNFIDTRASEKLKNVSENNSAIMNKKISKIIRDYTKLRDKFLNRYHKKRFPKSQQKHFCAFLLHKKT